MGGSSGLMNCLRPQSLGTNLRAGDSSNSNNVNSVDFTILRATFGKRLGDPGYDERADFNNDSVVNSADFNLQKGNFGVAGAPANCP